MLNHYRLLFLSLMMLALSACGGSNTNERSSESSSAEDSVLPESPQVERIVRLPDTVYASASVIKYKVEILDSMSGRLSSLADLYRAVPGVFTFRGGACRQADFNGAVQGTPSEFVIDWKFETAVDTTRTKYGVWGGGTGWTGQPLFVEWPDSCLNILRKNQAVNTGFSGKEIIVGSLCGKVYCIDFETGNASRSPIPVGNPVKGTVSLDPTLNGNLYVGQGIPAERPFGALAINLYNNSQFDFFKEDPNAYRHWGAYDSSPLRVGQFLFRPSENGSVYKYNVGPGRLQLHSILRYRINGAGPGIESSMAVYANYGYVADNHGNVIAINLDTMKPVWRYAFGDDADATPVIAVENGRPCLYLGCEIDLQSEGKARFAKIDGVDGTELWRTEIEGRRDDADGKHFDGGFYSSALLGQGDCEDRIFVNCVKNTKGRNGVFLAFDRESGKILYETPLKRYAWSSPVGFVNEKGELFVVTGDCLGNMYIIRGKSGEIIHTEQIGYNFESSPVVSGNSLVIGSRGRTIFKISVK